MTVRAYSYERRGLLAIDPQAFAEIFFLDDAPRENVMFDDVVIVDIRGPLEQHAHPWRDSYEDIAKRVEQACTTAARAVVLRFDSPGGEAGGVFDAADRLRAICDAAGKQLHAYVESKCASAAYALAARAQSITLSSTALVGSIGILSCRADVSQRNAQEGLRVALITSGARKADGHPDQPLSDAELAQTQATIDSVAQVFFDLVADARGMSAESVRQLDAAVFHGPMAIAKGLADEIGTLNTVLARVAGVASGAIDMTAYEKARAALEEAAKGTDANAEAARRALAALEAQPPADDPPPKDDEPAKDDAPADPPEKKDDEETKTAAAAYREALQATARVAELTAEIKRRDEAQERADLIASRPGMSPEMRALLQRAPMALVRETIGGMSADAGLNPEALDRAPTRGDATTTAARLSPAERDKLDMRMGLVESKPTAVNTPYELKLGVYQPVKRTQQPLDKDTTVKH